MTTFQYKAFGLLITSELEIPEFIPEEGIPDVYIGFGEVPEELFNPQFKGVRFQASPNQLILKVDRIANYFIEGGNTITIQHFLNSNIDEVRLFLLGSAFGALLHQRGLLPMHGSSLIFNDRAIIFSGVSGAGKSTLAAGFLKRNYKLLSDDISVVSLDENKKPWVFPGYPHMKLWADSLEKLGMNPLHLSRVRPQLNKHNLPVNNSFVLDSILLSGIYILQTKNTSGILLEPLKGIEKFNALKNNTYRLNFIQGLGNNESHFTHLSALAQHCFVTRITRPSKGFSLEELLATIEKELINERTGL
jgi:hypothetical protein